MAELSWLDALAARDPGEVLLASPRRDWQVGEARAEIAGLCEPLAASRVVGVLADNGPPWVLADLACQSAGRVHLPLPDFFSAAQLHHALESSGADTVLTDRPERIGALDLDFAITGRWQGMSWMRRVAKPAVLPAGTAKISFTSGSTGTPKGVCLSAAGLLDTARAVEQRLTDLPLSRHLAVLPLALLLENVAGVYAPLLRGIPVHLPPLAAVGWREGGAFDPARLQHAVAEAQAGTLVLVPELLKAWMLYLGQKREEQAPASLRFVAVGGARVAPALLRGARAADIPAYQGYGLTEAGSVVALNRPGDEGEGVGRPLAHARLSLVAGELRVETRAFLGYAGAVSGAAATAAGAARDAVPPTGQAFPTGDLAAIDTSGHLHLHGRRTNLLITSFGRNVSPEWVEAALLAEPEIAQALVTGDGQPAVSAMIVPAPGADERAVAAAVARANAGLPGYARIGHWLPSEPFTVGNGLATGNGRPRRPQIIDHHAAAIAALHMSEVPEDAFL